MVLIQAELTQRGSISDSLSREVYAKRIRHLGLFLSLCVSTRKCLSHLRVGDPGGFTLPKR